MARTTRGSVTDKAKVLAACPPFAMPAIERALGPHVDITFVNTLVLARELMRTTENLAMVICGVHFDESRMYDLLDYARRDFPHVPFLCVRILQSEIPQISLRALAIAAESLGAIGMIDFAATAVEKGQAAAEQNLRTAVLARLERGTARGIAS